MASRNSITKKLINSPETCVDDNLRGVVAIYPQLQLYPKHRVVTFRRQNDSKRVAVLGGGGSGHEPFAAGLIGQGMLDGAVAGGIFASPPTGHVLYAIAQLFKYHSGGVLVILGNYTGDRLNFGKAIEKAKISGIKVEGLIVGEDVASSHNKTGGRSMCGEVFFFKLCGAMAEKGYDLQKMREVAAEANKYMATLGVTLAACSLPGQPPLFEIALNEMEVGAGVHGEAGIQKIKMTTAREVVRMILDKVIEHLKLLTGSRVAVMINNLGGTSFLEMNIIAAETKEYLDTKQIKTERIYSGHLKTSLDMHGIQICLFHLNSQFGDLWLELLDAPTIVAGWTGGEISKRGEEGGVGDDDEAILQSHGTKIESGLSLSKQQQLMLKDCLLEAGEQLIENEELLNRLDSGCGDGDCGNTLKKFGIAIKKYTETASMEKPSNVLWDLSEIAETHLGGTSGGIYSLGLAAASQAISGVNTIDASTWSNAWKSAIEAITKYGGAEPGDRTMLDSLHPAFEAFKVNLSKGLEVAAGKSIEAAEKGAKETATMIANAGRASYVSSDYTEGEDAGARAVTIWLTAVLARIGRK